MARDRQKAKARRRARAENPVPDGPVTDRAPATPESGDQAEFEAAMAVNADPNADAQAAFGERDETRAEDAALEREAVAAAPAGAATATRTRAGEPTRRGPARFLGFLRACWSELQRVQWPDRIQVAQATAVVIGFVVVAGLYLGVADYVAKQIVNAII